MIDDRSYRFVTEKLNYQVRNLSHKQMKWLEDIYNNFLREVEK